MELKDRFIVVGTQSSEVEKISKPSLSFWKDVFYRFRKNKLALVGVVLLILLIIMAIFGPYMTGYDYASNDLVNKNQPPSADHWFGTDDLGRDVFIRTWEGARISIFIGIAAALIDLIIGVFWGGISGYNGGRVDEYMMRIADMLLAGIPYLLLVILLMVVLGSNVSTMIIGNVNYRLGEYGTYCSWTSIIIKNQEYVLASRTLGANTSRIMRKHLIPNAMGPIISNDDINNSVSYLY